MASFPDQSLQTVSGTVTAWLPISSPWLSIAECSSQIYAQRAGLGGNLIAFDPIFEQLIIPSATRCLPTEVTSSWHQSNAATTTLLGPTFVCPGAYSAVETILVNSNTQQILCCPSDYSLNIPITGQGTFPSQCTSSLTVGQTLTYESTTPSGQWGIATSTVPVSTAVSTGPTIVFGMHVNGFNVISTSAAGSSLLGTISGTLLPSSHQVTTPPTATASRSATPRSSSLSNGAIAAIGVVAALLTVAMLLGIWFLFRRARMAKQKNVYAYSGASTHYAGPTHGPFEVESSNTTKPMVYEADGSNSIRKMKAETMHEMSAT